MHRMVFTQILYKLTLAAFCCSLASGCVSYRKVKIEMLEPAEITLRENSVLAYLDRNIIYKPDTLPPLWNIRKQVPKVFGEGLNSGLFYAEPADTAVIMEEKKSSYYRGIFPPPLNAEILTKLNKKLGVDYIISLECHYLERKEHKNFYSWFVRLYDAHSGESADSLVMISKISNSKDILPYRTMLCKKPGIKAWNMPDGSRHIGKKASEGYIVPASMCVPDIFFIRQKDWMKRSRSGRLPGKLLPCKPLKPD